jgi:diaminohydroxyphosphoribosylaminopyrimidine deaminase/5-amino-6-(5-phosphoribosylamino)uracil reductase
VVVDAGGKTPRDARVLDSTGRTLVATVGAPYDEEHGLVLPAGPDGRVDLAALLRALHEREVVSVLLEGGPTLAASFLRAGLVDRVVGYVAPALLGAGPAALGDAGIGTIADALRLRLDDVTRVGEDVRLTLRRA